jgi:hypothetical protein
MCVALFVVPVESGNDDSSSSSDEDTPARRSPLPTTRNKVVAKPAIKPRNPASKAAPRNSKRVESKRKNSPMSISKIPHLVAHVSANGITYGQIHCLGAIVVPCFVMLHRLLER